MKNLKSKLLILLISIISLTSLLFVGSQKAEKVYAALSDLEQTQKESISISNFTSSNSINSGNSKTMTYNLYGIGSQTSNYYSVKIEKSGVIADSIISGSNSISGDQIYVSLNASYATNNNSIVKAYTKFSIPEDLVNVSQKGYLTITLSAYLCPASNQPDTHYMEW